VKSTDYGALADKYAAHRRPHPGVLAALASALDASSRVLEIGCGTGNYLAELRSAVGCACTGVDPSPEMLAKLRQRDSSIEAMDGRAEALDLPSESYDLLYSVDVIHHVRDRAAAFAEAFRVVAAGGSLCTVTDSEWILKNRAPLSVYFPETVDVELRRYPRIESLREEMERAGFVRLREDVVEHSSLLCDSSAYRDKVFSSLLRLDDEAFRRGLARMDADLARGPIPSVARYLVLRGDKA
jgi:SAM-dependent methyltransferase